MPINRPIDHIVYAVSNLEEGMAHFEQLTGVRPVFGGYHTTKGTKNALVRLGGTAYLELLAVDHENTTVSRSRWMGVDLVNEPMLTRWSLKSDNLALDSEVLKKHQADMGVIQGGERKTAVGDWLRWQMILPLAEPLVEVVPFFTDWQNSSVHPAAALDDRCVIIELKLAHPNPAQVQATMDALAAGVVVEKGESPKISLHLQTPRGVVVLE